MYAQVEKRKENKRRVVANTVGQKKNRLQKGLRFVDNQPKAVAQRMTNPYTAEELGFPGPPATFPNQIIQLIVYQRAQIPGHVIGTVNGHIDNEPGHTLNKHYIPHMRIINNLINMFQGLNRTAIVAQATAILGVLGLPIPAGTPLTFRAQFDIWLDDAFVTIADNPNIIFRGPSTGDHGGTTLDNPAGGINSAAQIARLAGPLAIYTAQRLWP